MNSKQNFLINLKEDRKDKKRTEPQITPELYAKWLTDKYNREIAKYKYYIKRLERKLSNVTKEFEDFKSSKASKRLKYMNDVDEFSKELMKDNIIISLKENISKLTKTIVRLRQDNEKLIIENLKLKENG